MPFFTRSLSVALMVLVGACSPERAQYTLEEYRANDELRHAQVERCRNDPGSLAKTPDCINARQAAAFEDRLRLRDAPPVGLDQKRDRSDAGSEGEPNGGDEPATSPDVAH